MHFQDPKFLEFFANFLRYIKESNLLFYLVDLISFCFHIEIFCLFISTDIGREMTKTIRKVSRIDGQTPRKFGGSNKPSKSRWWWPFADRISLAELNPFIFIPKLLFDPAYFYTFGILILIAETIICPLIIRTRTCKFK